MPASRPRSTLTVTVLPAFKTLCSAGSTILKANAGCAASARQTAKAKRKKFILSLQVERHVGENHPLFEEQGRLQHERALVMQDILPPPGRQDLRDDDRHPAVGVLLEQLFDVVQQRSNHRAVGGRE